MPWFSDNHEFAQAFGTVNNAPHKAQLSHELIAGAATYEIAKSYERHVQKHGKPANHAQAKEILAGLSGVFIDRLVETKGLDLADKEKAKHDARKRAEQALASSGDY